MTTPRRFAAVAALAAALLPCGVPAAQAQQAQRYPERPVRLVVPFVAGGGGDINGRVMAQKLTARLGQQFVVDNRPGAGGNIGTVAVARAEPDGHTLLLTTVATTVNPSLYANAGYTVQNDLAAVAQWSTSPLLLIVHPAVPATTLAEFVAYARANPGRVTFASGGIGLITHIVGELLRVQSGLEMVHVPYRGQAPAVTATVAGEVAMLVDSVASGLPHLRSGRLRALAVTDATRAPTAPEVPSVVEAGFPHLVAAAWYGLAAPARTPPPVIRRLNEAVNAALEEEETRRQLAAYGASPAIMTPEEYTRFLHAEVARWGEVARAANIRVE